MKTCPTEVAVGRIMFIISQMVVLYYALESKVTVVGVIATLLIGVVIENWRREVLEYNKLTKETQQRNKQNGKEDHQG